MKPSKEQLELRRKWVEALRSGKYEQTKGHLYDGKGYCCLGVACVVAGFEPYQRACEKWWFKEEANYLPFEVQQMYGFTSNEGTYGEAGDNDLASDNDNNGKTFAQIADIIEANPSIWAEYEWPEPPTEEEMSGD